MATAPSTSAPSVVPPPAAVTETAPSLPSPPPPVASPPAALPTPPAASSAPPAAVSSAVGDPGREGPVPVWPGHGASGDIAGAAAPEGGPGGEDAIGATAGAGGDAAAGGGTGGGTLALAIPGDGASAYGPYLALLRRRVQEAMTYPAAARRRGLSGTVHLEIALDPSGEISDVTLARSSAHRLLDDTAVESVRSLRRVPFPPDVRPRALRVRLPVVFELR
jgi:protein TonB